MPHLPANNRPSLNTDTRSFKNAAPDAGSIPSLPTGPKLVVDGDGYTAVKMGPRAQLPIPQGAEYVTARQYCTRLGGISFTTLARMSKRDPEFPRAIYFANRIRFFKLSDILAYEHLCEVRSAAKAMINNEI